MELSSEMKKKSDYERTASIDFMLAVHFLLSRKMEILEGAPEWAAENSNCVNI